MLKLTELLCIYNLKVTFLNTAYSHKLLLQFTDVQTRLASYSNFRFEVIPDGLPDDHPRSGERVMDLFKSLEETAQPAVREILLGYRDDVKAPVTCLILDGLFGFGYDVAEKVGVPVIAFRTISACSFWAYCCVPQLIQAGELPFDDDQMDMLVKNVPGMENFLRYRDLPSFCRTKDLCDQNLQLTGLTRQQTGRAHGLILNTFEGLEGHILTLIRAHCSSKVYSIGPLHSHLKYMLCRDATSPSSYSANNLWEVDKSCLSWLDAKPSKSVIYVSFGSVTTIKKEQLRELWAGLVYSEKMFLWVIRPDLILETYAGDDPTPSELLEGTKERGYMVNWAPQEDVLAHPAIGGFLTHSGWNSTLESTEAGVPMLCWPYFADQQINSRYVSEVWKIGLDMKDTCDRMIVKKKVDDLMTGVIDGFQASVSSLSRQAKTSISDGGSSRFSLKLLVEDIISTTHKKKVKHP